MCVMKGYHKTHPHYHSQVKLNSKYYCSHLKGILLPVCNLLSAGEKYHFMHDEATFNPPDFNPLNYIFVDKIKHKLHVGQQTPFQNIAELKKQIQNIWRDVNTIKEI